MTPQTKTVLRHLQVAGSITSVEAEACHKVRHLPARIHELKKAGVEVKRELRKDITGQRFMHYSLA